MTARERPHVLILGAGFVAIGAVIPLRKAIRAGEIDVTVVDRENYHFYHGIVSEFLLGRIGATNVLSPARRIVAPAKLHVAEIEAIDIDAKRVTTSRALDGARQELTYDHLIVGLGSVDNLDLYPGLAEHAFKLKSYDDCFRLKNHILTMFELASIERDREERRALLTFFIAGGGYAGTEVAGELAEFARHLCERDFSEITRAEVRVVLVQPGDHILPELYGSSGKGAEGHPRLVNFAERHMKRLGVEVVTGNRVAAASPNHVMLSNGERIPTRTIISAVGTKMPPVLDDLDVPRDQRRRLITDRFLRVGEHHDVWAGGDCAAVPEPGGGTSPPRALQAKQHGIRAATNILRSLEGLEPEPYTYKAFGQGVPLGRHTAVGELKGIGLRGTLAWFFFKAFLLYFTPTWDRRLRIASDWILAPVVGRDIVESSISDSDDYELRQDLYQPGEVILTEGRGDRYTHVILEGEVELLRHADGTETVTGTLQPGDQIGAAWVDSTFDESARARTVVKTVALRRDQTRAIQRLVTSLRGIAAPEDR